LVFGGLANGGVANEEIVGRNKNKAARNRAWVQVKKATMTTSSITALFPGYSKDRETRGI
jgi:hypothetical protein